jgi:CheY-like chemotaxis protein
VLVVEDEVLTRMIIADTLRETGFHVVEAGNAEEAMDYVRAGAPVDLVFADIDMPGAVNGVGLAHWLQARSPNVPVILTSGGAAKLPAAGAAFIAKPYGLDKVVALICDALAASGYGRE